MLLVPQDRISSTFRAWYLLLQPVSELQFQGEPQFQGGAGMGWEERTFLVVPKGRCGHGGSGPKGQMPTQDKRYVGTGLAPAPNLHLLPPASH